MALATHHHLALSLEQSKVIPQLPLCAFMTFYKENFLPFNIKFTWEELLLPMYKLSQFFQPV
jgi:hypothetical protein